MLSKFSSVPTDFEHKNAINARTAKRSSTTNKVSFRNTIRNTCEYLVWGYATSNNLQMSKQTLHQHVPHEIKQICFNYFIGDFPACASIYDDQLSNSNEEAKTELVQASLNLLCSATITQSGSKLLVAHFIDLLAPKTSKVLSKADIDRMFPFKAEWSLRIEHGKYFRKVYLSYLLSLTEIIYYSDMIDAKTLFSTNRAELTSNDGRTIHVYELNPDADALREKYEKYGQIELIDITADEMYHHNLIFITFVRKDAANKFIIEYLPTRYKELMVDIPCSIGDTISVQLIYELISQNNIFYEIYKSRVTKVRSMHMIGERSFTYVKWDSLFNSVEWFIKQNKFEMNTLRKLVMPLVFSNTEMDKMENVPSSCYLSTIIFSEEDQKIALLWLKKELEYEFVNNYSNICLHKTLLEGIIRDIFSKLQADDVFKIQDIIFQILYLLIVTAKLDVSYKINNFERFLNIVSELLRSDKYGIIGWKIINTEIDQMINNNDNIITFNSRYEYFDEWIEYFESRTGLFKMNIVANIRILQVGKNMKDADLQLKVATAVCFKINQLSWVECDKFTKFYRKLQKTKLIKPILHELFQNNI